MLLFLLSRGGRGVCGGGGGKKGVVTLTTGVQNDVTENGNRMKE